MKSMVIGAVDNYEWKDIRVWAHSLVRTGYKGEVVVIVYRASQELIDNCVKLGFTVIIAEHDEFGRPIEHNKFGLPTQAHKLRNFHAWQYLTEYEIDSEARVIITDTRDVCFQEDPDTFTDDIKHRINMPSENVLFKDEPWNLGMVQQLFGPNVADTLLNKPACNSGTFFGPAGLMKDFLFQMYMVERDFKTTGSDQPTMNVLGHNNPLVRVLPLGHGWAFQCGTTIDPTKKFPQIQPLESASFETKFKTLYHFDVTESIVDRSEGCFNTVTGKLMTIPYIILHQYDRVPELKPLIEKKYETL